MNTSMTDQEIIIRLKGTEIINLCAIDHELEKIADDAERVQSLLRVFDCHYLDRMDKPISVPNILDMVRMMETIREQQDRITASLASLSESLIQIDNRIIEQQTDD